MITTTLFDLQLSVQDVTAFRQIEDYFTIAYAFLQLLNETKPTRIVAPNDPRYVFYQYDEIHSHRITRPLNSDLFIEAPNDFRFAFERFLLLLADLKKYGEDTKDMPAVQKYLATNEINQVVYTAQQSIGSIGDSFANPNQSRKRIGQLFENLIKLIVKEIGFACDSRTIFVPIPGSPDYTMSYELDLVFSKEGAIITSENAYIYPNEVIGSVKTTSKDRIDKIFLDKFLLAQLLGREVKVVAIFLHDVQRALRANSIFGINSTFKSNHFLGYSLALNRLNGVYYVDPLPEMRSNPRLRHEIDDFQHFISQDIWTF